MYAWIFRHLPGPLWVRILHMTLFEGGLVLFLVPAVALILQVSLWEAFLYELSRKRPRAANAIVLGQARAFLP